MSMLKPVSIGLGPMTFLPFRIGVEASPMASPIRPPPRLNSVASVMNWNRISRRLAPIAFLMPISRVRSVTETSMMFMMPMPPTTREMPAIAPRKMTSAFVVSSNVSSSSWLLLMVKSSSPVILCRSRRLIATSSSAWSMKSSPLAWTVIWSTATSPWVVLCNDRR